MKKRRSTRKVTRISSTELDQFKAFLGPLAQDYTDGELRQLRLEMHAMAEILLDLYLARRDRQAAPVIRF